MSAQGCVCQVRTASDRSCATGRDQPSPRSFSRMNRLGAHSRQAKMLTCGVVGLGRALVEAEVDIGPGLPAFNIVGPPDTAMREAGERIREGCTNSGCVPQRRTTPPLPLVSAWGGGMRQTGTPMR
jgi:hypothetical protein